MGTPESYSRLEESLSVEAILLAGAVAAFSWSIGSAPVLAAGKACGTRQAPSGASGMSILPADQMPPGWGQIARKGPPVDTYGNPIVNERPGLPGWAQRDVDDLRLAIANTYSSLRDLPEDLRGPTEDLLGNYLGQAMVRGIDVSDLIDVRREASPRVGDEILGFLHAYENRRREFAPIDGYRYEPTDYDAETVSLIEHLGGSLSEIRQAAGSAQSVEPGDDPSALGGADCYQISTSSLGMAALSGATSIWVGEFADDEKEAVHPPLGLNAMCRSGTDNHVWVSTNGLVLFGGSTGDGADDPSNVAIPNTALPNRFAAPSWDDYRVRTGLGYIDKVRHKTEGTVGQRIFVVEWLSVGHVGGWAFDVHSFQFVFREADLGIEFRYGTWNDDETVASATVGLETTGGTVGQCLDCTATNEVPTHNLLFLPKDRPANDELADAICIDFEGPVSGTTVNASSSPTRLTSACDDRDVYDVWYYLDAPGGEVTFDTCGADLDHMTLVVENEGLMGCSSVNCGFGGTTLTADLDGGTRYWIRAAGQDNRQGDFTLTATPTEMPSADSCAAAFAFGGEESLVLSNTDDNSGCESESSCGCSDTIDEWLAWTPPISGNAVASTCHPETDFDTTLAVFDGCGGTELAFRDDFGIDFGLLPCPTDWRHSRVAWPVTAGSTYYVRVAGWGRGRGDYRLNLRVSPLFEDDFEWGNTSAWSKTSIPLP